MKNPFRVIREDEMELSRKAFCVQYSVPISTLANCENGNITTVPESMLTALRRAGVSRERLDELPTQFRKWQREQVAEEIRRKKMQSI